MPLLGTLEVELDAATTKEDILEVIEKFNKLRGINYPE